MKKYIFFLIIICIITFYNTSTVKAAKMLFYEAEYIDNIWMKKREKNSNTTYYQTARFFRHSGTNNHAYCIEPFKFFKIEDNYEPTLTPDSLTQSQKEKIELISYYGYGYKNHTEPKWYAITQFMIWQAADPEGDFYFTDSLAGNRITRFEEEINEINTLVNTHQKNPSFDNQTYTIVEGNSLIIEDYNNVLDNYIITNSNQVKISNNKLIIEELKTGNYKIKLKYKDNQYNTPMIFYQATLGQDLLEIGNLTEKDIELNINVIDTSLTIIKTDSITKTTTASGEGKLEGANYQLFDANMNKIDTLTIDEDKKIILKNLNLGKYYLQEISAGEGYELDKEIYSFELTEKNNKIELILENNIIIGKLIINKLFGTENKFQPETNISFNIYNNKNNLVKTIITNSNGIAETELPYGTYNIVQLTTTEGYQKIEPITIKITNSKTINKTFKNYKIKVPDTKTSSLIESILIWIKKLIYLK